MTVSFLLRLVALACFVAATVGVGTRFNLMAAGLALVTLSMLIGGGGVALD